MITFKSTVQKIGSSIIVQLPEGASEQLPSRGQVSVKGTINGYDFERVLEPDGKFGHWFKCDATLRKSLGLSAGDTVTVEIDLTKNWPEPTVPSDFAKALATASVDTQAVWKAITPMARWEWVRWINATNDDVTRKRRVEVSIAKMASGKRRPCCFNLASCTDPSVSKSGKLVTTDNS